MKVRELLSKLKDLPPDTLVCVAELEEAFAVNASEIELVENAKAHSRDADGREAVELGGGNEKAVIIRW